MKKFLSRIVTLSLIMCLTFQITPVYAAYISVSVPMIEQTKSCWCWAASVEMVAKGLGYKIYDQWDVLQNKKGNNYVAYPNAPGSDVEMWGESNIQEKENIQVLSKQKQTTKKYTEKEYTGKYSSGEKNFKYSVLGKFAYDGKIVSCYQATGKILRGDDNSQYHPKVVKQVKDTISPTLACARITFVLYDAKNKPQATLTVRIYCNQKGHIWMLKEE